ncbi:cytochrome c oxidase subunit 8 [Rhodnius prolixus]|uniref:Cytochrome c oxidase polypeptide viii n=4 Tax=Arthropoda TaxID=6656 RepID=T1HI48_RHOPR
MASVRNSLNCLRLLGRSLNVNQQRTVVSGPPAQRVSFAEKCAHGVVLSAGMFAVPIWIICHIRSYRERS